MCDRAIYVVGSSQALHFQMVFAVARQAGWIPAAARFEHAQIGTCWGPTEAAAHQGRRHVKLQRAAAGKASSGPKVSDELDTSPGSSERERDAIAEAVGIGAVKYADLSTARDSEYVFDWDRMISFRGNTGPYLQYATTRIRSIFRRAGAAPTRTAARPDQHGRAAAERALALRLLGFRRGGQRRPGRPPSRTGCAGFLFDVASLFTTFYEQCPVLKAEPESMRASPARAVRAHAARADRAGPAGVPGSRADVGRRADLGPK